MYSPSRREFFQEDGHCTTFYKKWYKLPIPFRSEIPNFSGDGITEQ